MWLPVLISAALALTEVKIDQTQTVEVLRQKTFCHEFYVPKNYKQVRLDFEAVPKDANVLISSKSLRELVCTEAVTVDISLKQTCKNSRTCSYYRDIYGPLSYRSEQCSKDMYVLVFATAKPEITTPEKISLTPQYVDGVACNSIYKGVHETPTDEILCGKRDFNLCQEGIACSLIRCEDPTKEDIQENICVPRRFDH